MKRRGTYIWHVSKSMRQTNGKWRHFSLRMLLIFLPPPLLPPSIGIPAWKWRNGVTGTRLLISCNTVSTAIRWHQTRGSKNMETEEREERESTTYRETSHLTSSMPSCAPWTLHPAPSWLWWKAGRNPFQFGQRAPVLLKAIDWLNRGTISQYAGADEPGREERGDMAPEERERDSGIHLSHT